MSVRKWVLPSSGDAFKRTAALSIQAGTYSELVSSLTCSILTPKVWCLRDTQSESVTQILLRSERYQIR
jgi:hypothetical protein